MVHLNIKDSFTKELPGDNIIENFVRPVKQACYSFVAPTPCAAPQLIIASKEVGALIGLTEKDFSSKEFLSVFSGNSILPNTKPFAMCYGGHQFGTWAGQLGDGRAINLFEVMHQDQRWMLQLKGAGKTPYSRSADGLAVLRSSVREYLCSEAMHYLGVPTTRALSLITTGDQVLRDMFYNGQAAYEPGAIVCRVAPTFLRFGNYQILAAQGDKNLLAQLVDYTLKYFYPHYTERTKEAYLQWLQEVGERTMKMVIEWERVGFVHGVMNTDNMSILGITIDYGPYGWLEDYDPDWTPNTTDAQGKRYRFGHQASIALWNLIQLANALHPLIEDVKAMETVLEQVQQYYYHHYTKMMMGKLGLQHFTATTKALLQMLPELLQQSEMDMTIFYRNLSSFQQFDDAWWAKMEAASYKTDLGKQRVDWKEWFDSYASMIQAENNSNRVKEMNLTNPKYVFRNFMAQQAIDKATQEDYSLIETMANLLQHPYDEQPENEQWFAKRPDWAINKPGCSMLSCSS